MIHNEIHWFIVIGLIENFSPGGGMEEGVIFMGKKFAIPGFMRKRVYNADHIKIGLEAENRE